MKKVWMVADSVVSPLGTTSQANYLKLRKGISGIALVDDPRLSPSPFYVGAIPEIPQDGTLTRFEKISTMAIADIMSQLAIPLDKTLFILSSTKGNIAFLEEGLPGHPRIHLHALADFLAQRFGFKESLVVSNACISGVMALIVGKRMIEAGEYDHALIVGTDVLSRFIISGFQSLQALSPEPCRPFDAGRKGINLGECAAAILLSSDPHALGTTPKIQILGGGLSNDANHISGPSRTGEELVFAVRQAMEESRIPLKEIDFISAHGTATLYNDEMEAKAFSLLGMNNTPLNSLKGYFGHTLGAAGVAEVAMSAESLLMDELVPSKGFEKLGVSQPVNVIRELEKRPLNTCLKTASGFGGCNAAIILQKENN
jgi:3-oxoacyl-[acyl-carrier-protein] synthase-1